VISGLLEDSKLSAQLASWALDIIQLCQRALKSSGNGEPTYRIAAIRAACSVVVATRMAFMKTREIWGSDQFVLKGAFEDKSIFEMVKLLKIAAQDKFPEVRGAATRLACLLGPVAINLHIKSQSSPEAQATSPTTCLEDIMTLAFKNLDDESPHVSEGWAEALARCMCTSIEFKSQTGSDRGRSDDDEDGSGEAPENSSGRGGKKGTLSAEVCNTLPRAMKYLVSVFIKVGGELTAPRAGGYFSTGGRAVRVGLARSMIHLLRLQLHIESIGEGRSLSYRESVLIILAMVGNDMETQLNPKDRSAPTIQYLDATTVVTSRISSSSDAPFYSRAQAGRNLFGQSRKVCDADGCIARVLTNRVLRDGLGEQLSEATQLKILHEMIDLCANKQNALKANQLQVILVEISHLFFSLGEATASSLEELVPGLLKCLRHPDHGVRYEAAITSAAIASVFPGEGRRLVRDGLNRIQEEYEELMSVASSSEQLHSGAESSAPRFRFGMTSQNKKKKTVDKTLKHQFAIHGMSFMVATVVRDLPHLPGGLPTDILDTIMSVCEKLISTLTNDVAREGSPSSACTCVRAGFHLISGALTIGPDAISNQIAMVFGLWQKVCKSAKLTANFTADHELMCVEAMLTSIVTFLKFCAELLLSIPDALSRTSIILENLLPLFFGKGRLGSKHVNPAAACRHDSAKASIMEAFAWLPPGSYPMVADSVFNFAAAHIQLAIQNDVSCSILPSLISKEDAILDSISFERARKVGQVGGARDLGRDIIALTSQVAHHGERESAIALLGKKYQDTKSENDAFLGSEVLALLEFERKEKPVTVLHQCGTWSRPVDPSHATRIRVVDAAVQVFASTFALRSGKDQQKAIVILQSLLPPAYFQSGRNAKTTDQDRTGKFKDSLASTTNIAAVLLSCVKALPVDESTHDIPIGLGPSWKNKASAMLVSLLSSPVNDIRRAAAEGLSFLATLGVQEDMRFLQSSVLHSLDEVISRNAQAQGRNTIQDDLQNGRSGGLLALACLQRSTYRISKSRASRLRLRGSPVQSNDQLEDSLQTVQIMTRVLPYVDGRLSSGISMNARASALHSILMLLEYSGKMDSRNLNEENLHLLKKAVEIVEGNYLSAWTSASHSLDRGNEAQKICYESCFLSVLLRFMTFLIPFLYHLGDSDSGVAKRFSTMAVIIMECYGHHTVVQLEALAFFEVLTANQALLPAQCGGIKYDEYPILSCIPFLLANLSPNRSQVLSGGIYDITNGCHSSDICLRATLRVLQSLSMTQILVAEWSNMKVVSLLHAALECSIASTSYTGETFHRGLAASRDADMIFKGVNPCGKDIAEVLRCLPYLERVSSRDCESLLLRYILVARSIIVGNSMSYDEEDEESHDVSHTVARVSKNALEQAALDSNPLFDLTRSSRWQVKLSAVQMMTIALMEFATKCREETPKLENSEYFNPELARSKCLKACNVSNAANSSIPESVLALHIPELISCCCMVATATVDQVELRMLQENSMYCLEIIISSFGMVPEADGSHISILCEYIPQISSCIKGSIAALDENIDELTCRLFWAGCSTLRSFLRSNITDDKAVLKRLIRPVILTKEEVPFFSFNSTMPVCKLGVGDSVEHRNSRADLLIKIGKIWMFGNLPLENAEISRLIEPENKCIGVHAAALALDGARSLLRSNLSLCGQPTTKTAIQSENDHNSFYCFRDMLDVDDYSKAALAKTWSSSANLAVKLLFDAINSEKSKGEEVKEECVKWLELLFPFLFEGLYDAIDTMNGKDFGKDTLVWAENIDPCDVACSCLTGLVTLTQASNLSHVDKRWRQEIEYSTNKLYTSVFLPALKESKSPKRGHGGRRNTEGKVNLVAKSCQLLKTFSESIVLEGNSDSSQFLATLLSPLDLVVKKEVTLANDLVATIVAACLNAVAGIIRMPESPSSLVKVMLSLAISLTTETEVPSKLVGFAAQELLEDCLKHKSATMAELIGVTSKLAEQKNWTAWLSMVKINDGIAAEDSLLEIERAFLNPPTVEEQLEALGTIRCLVQSSPPPNPLTGRILSALGAEILSVFEGYGTLSEQSAELQSKRVAACADCMKVALATYQQFSTDCPDGDTTEFLIMLFEVFIIVLRFNGLPNHPPPQGALSEPSIGRMCAQAITHIARTTPIPFKASMGGMSEHDRAVLEFAVRGEMSGYAVAAAPAPVKKKLSLKGFRK